MDGRLALLELLLESLALAALSRIFRLLLRGGVVLDGRLLVVKFLALHGRRLSLGNGLGLVAVSAPSFLIFDSLHKGVHGGRLAGKLLLGQLHVFGVGLGNSGLLENWGGAAEEGFDGDLHEIGEALANELGVVNDFERLIYKDSHSFGGRGGGRSSRCAELVAAGEELADGARKGHRQQEVLGGHLCGVCKRHHQLTV